MTGRSNPVGVLNHHRRLNTLRRERHRLGNRTTSIPDEGDLLSLSGLTARRVGDHRTRKRTDVQPITTLAVPAITTVPHLHDVLAIRRHLNRCRRILLQQRTVVHSRQLKATVIQNRYVGVKQSLTKSHALDFHRQTLTLLRVHHEVVHVLVLNHTRNRHVQRNLLRCSEVRVGLLLLHHRQRTHKERAVIRNTAFCAHLSCVLAQSTVRSNLHLHINIIRIDRLDLQNLKTRFVEKDLLGVAQSRSRKTEHLLGATLSTPGQDHRQRRIRPLHNRRHKRHRQHQHQPRQTPHSRKTTRCKHIVVLIP